MVREFAKRVFESQSEIYDFASELNSFIESDTRLAKRRRYTDRNARAAPSFCVRRDYVCVCIRSGYSTGARQMINVVVVVRNEAAGFCTDFNLFP